MAYLLDGILIVLFALMVYSGIKQGFIRTISGVLTFVLALILSALLAAPAASLAYDVLVEPKVLSSFGEDVESDGITAAEVDEAIRQMPPFVTDLLVKNGITTGEQVLDKVDEDASSPAQSIADQVVAPTAKAVLEPICSLILFVVLQFILGWLMRTLNLLAKIPVVKQANKALGVVAGVIKGLLWVFFAVSVMDVLAASGLLSFLTPQVMESTYLVEWLTAFNPLGSTLQSFVM